MQPPPPPLPQAAFGDQVLPEKAMHPTNIRRAALALEAHAHTMPPQRREHLSVSYYLTTNSSHHMEPDCCPSFFDTRSACVLMQATPGLAEQALPGCCKLT